MKKKSVKNEMSRRNFLKVSSLTAAAIITPDLATKALGIETGVTKKPEVKWKEGDDILLRMREELSRALEKPLEKRKWSMVIDLQKCVGCHSCTIACIAENVLPPGIVYRPVIEEEFGKYPNVGRRFTPKLCNHCDAIPCPCIAACPVKATLKRPDGIVDINYAKCIGCGYCIVSCPYHTRNRDHGEFYTKNTPKLEEYEQRPNYEYNKRWPRVKGKSPIGNARKCHFCIHRIEKGILPACTVTCIGKATYFGDLNDRDALVSSLASGPNAIVLKPEYGTKPSVYYLL